MTSENEQSKRRNRRLTRQEMNERIFDNPEIQVEVTKNPHVIRAQELYSDSAAGLLAELSSAGFHVSSVHELVRKGYAFKSVVSILIKWLPKVAYLPLVEDIVRALSVPFAREAVPVLLKMFRDPPDVVSPLRPADSPVPIKEHLRWVIGNTLGAHASPAIAEELLELAQDRSYGGARTSIILGLPKTKDERVSEVLAELLEDDDPEVTPYAVEAIGKMRIAEMAPRLEEMLDNPDQNTRTQAKKALRRINQ